MQHFLKLDQLLPPQSYPSSRVLRANRTYHFRFKFEIPEQLPSGACSCCPHDAKDDLIYQSHLNLPPTIGAQEALAAYHGAYDDMSPDTLSISYEVLTRIWSSGELLASELENVRVIPISTIFPLFQGLQLGGYQLREDKMLRKGTFRRKSGVLTMEAILPEAIDYVDDPIYQGRENIPMASIILCFTATDKGATPPHLGTLKTRLLVKNTQRGCKPHQVSDGPNTPPETGEESSTTTLKLPPKTFDKITWHKVSAALPKTAYPDTDSESSRHGSFSSGFSMGSTSRHGSDVEGLYSYITRLELPILFPESKMLVPTFHSCFMSRTYTLQCLLEVYGNYKMELRVPLVIANE